MVVNQSGQTEPKEMPEQHIQIYNAPKEIKTLETLQVNSPLGTVKVDSGNPIVDIGIFVTLAILAGAFIYGKYFRSVK